MKYKKHKRNQPSGGDGRNDIGFVVGSTSSLTGHTLLQRPQPPIGKSMLKEAETAGSLDQHSAFVGTGGINILRAALTGSAEVGNS